MRMKKDILTPTHQNEIMNREDLLLDITAMIDDEQYETPKAELLMALASDKTLQDEFYIQLKIKNLLRNKLANTSNSITRKRY